MSLRQTEKSAAEQFFLRREQQLISLLVFYYDEFLFTRLAKTQTADIIHMVFV